MIKTKPSGSNFYFTKETEEAIIAYNNSTDNVERNIIYSRKIHPALHKLAEIMVHRFKFEYLDMSYDDAKHEVIAFLFERLHKFDDTKGFKAFSFFSIVAKNFLMAENNKNYATRKRRESVDAIDSSRNVVNEELRRDFIETQMDFIEMFVEVLDEHMSVLFQKQIDQQIVESILYLFRKRESIENFNKKALYIIIKERTNAKPQQITSVIKQVKTLYSRLLALYECGIDLTSLDWYEVKRIFDGTDGNVFGEAGEFNEETDYE